MKQRIVLLGPPASGKGTQADLMHARYQLPITSPGAILREESKLRSVLGIEAERHTSHGHLVPDEVVNSVVKAWLDRHGSTFIFDGYPRSIGQATALDKMLDDRNTPLEVALLLQADLETIRDRVERRMVCSACRRVVSIGLHVSDASSVCPACGGALERRLDDTPATLSARMREYSAKTEPLIDYYAKRGLLRAVDAARAPEVVFQSIVETLEAA